MAARAGWYPDPRRLHEYRYWDGGHWTSRVADRNDSAAEPEPQRPTPPPSPASSPAPRHDPTAGWIMAAGAAVLFIGSLLPWATVSGIINVSKAGTDGDGVLTLPASLAIGLLAFFAIRKPGHVAQLITALVFAGGSLAVCVYDIVDVSRVADDVEETELATVSVGIGLWLAAIGAAGAAGGAIVGLVAGGRRADFTIERGP